MRLAAVYLPLCLATASGFMMRCCNNNLSSSSRGRRQSMRMMAMDQQPQQGSV